MGNLNILFVLFHLFIIIFKCKSTEIPLTMAATELKIDGIYEGSIRPSEKQGQVFFLDNTEMFTLEIRISYPATMPAIFHWQELENPTAAIIPHRTLNNLGGRYQIRKSGRSYFLLKVTRESHFNSNKKFHQSSSSSNNNNNDDDDDDLIHYEISVDRLYLGIISYDNIKILIFLILSLCVILNMDWFWQPI